MITLSIISKYWPSLLIFVTALLAGLMVYFQATADSSQNKKRVMLITSLFLLLCTMGSAIGSFVSNYKSDQQMTQVQDSVNATKTLSNLNYQLGQKIESLSNLNISIDSNTQLLVSESKNLITKNVVLTSTIPPLTKNVKDLVGKVDDEVTGGISIPLLTGNISADSIPYNFDVYQAEKYHDPIPTGKWILTISIQNTGTNKITDISLTQYHKEGRYPVEEVVNLKAPETLLDEKINVEIKEVTAVLPNTEDGIPPQYDIGYNYDNLDYTIKVRWRKTSYYYYYSIRGGNSLTLKESYQFNGKSYTDRDRFLRDIQDYIRKHDGHIGK